MTFAVTVFFGWIEKMFQDWLYKAFVINALRELSFLTFSAKNKKRSFLNMLLVLAHQCCC